MTTDKVMKETPTLPYIFFHPKFLWKCSGAAWQYEMVREDIEKEWWRSGYCFAIDVECRKFPLISVINLGRSLTIWNLLSWGRRKLFRMKYVFGEPTQLTFEQAREEFVEYVCRHRWWSASYETEKQFRARNAKYTNMRELMEPVSLKGKSLGQLKGAPPKHS